MKASALLWARLSQTSVSYTHLGLIARRIVCRVSEGDALERGQRYGMIRFGSRVDLYLPEGYVPSVNIGEQVFAGQSTLATRN